MIGVSYAKTVKTATATLKPIARLAMTYDIISDDENAAVRIGGVNYTVTGEKN